MGFLDKAQAAAEEAASRATEMVAEVQAKRELTKAYAELGETAFRLAEAGAISHPELEPQVAHVRELQAKADDQAADKPPESTEEVEQPLSGGGPGAT
jgi:hypothetical protein